VIHYDYPTGKGANATQPPSKNSVQPLTYKNISNSACQVEYIRTWYVKLIIALSRAGSLIALCPRLIARRRWFTEPLGTHQRHTLPGRALTHGPINPAQHGEHGLSRWDQRVRYAKEEFTLPGLGRVLQYPELLNVRNVIDQRGSLTGGMLCCQSSRALPLIT
jgi:hypothetical protein